jgi:hypothetical protein
MVTALVGRSVERRLLLDLLHREALGQSLLLTGEPGVGKTSVLGWAAVQGEAAGFRVLSARPAVAEASFAFSVIADLVRGLAPERRRLPAAQARALEVALLESDPGEVPVDDRAVCLATLRLLELASSAGPILLMVDDVQWADHSSLAVLGYAARRLDRSRLRWLLAARPLPGAWGGPLQESLVRDVQLLEHHVGGLSELELQELIEAHLGARPSRAVLSRIADLSGGNAFYALELARQGGQSGRLTGDLVATEDPSLPRDLRRLVAARLTSLEPGTRDLLRLVALAGRLTPSALAVHGDLDRAAVHRRLRPAIEAGVVQVAEHVQFTHPLLAAAVRDDIPVRERRRIHARLAATATTVERRARHRALGSARPSSRTAADLETAARQARDRGAGSTELELLELSIAATPPSRIVERDRRHVITADAAFRYGHTGRARRLLLELTARPGSQHAAEAFALLARIAWLEGPPDQVAVLGDAALAAATTTTQRARIEVLLAHLSRNDRSVGLEHARRALDLTVDDPSPEGVRVRASAIASLLDVTSDLGGCVDLALVDELLRLHPGIGPGRVADDPRYYLATTLFQNDLLDRARVLLVECEQAAGRRGDDGSLTAIDDQRAPLELLAGDWPGARFYARRQVSTAALCEQRLQELWGQETLALLDVREGKVGAERTAAEVLRRAQGADDPMTLAFALVLRAEQTRLAGDLLSATQALSLNPPLGFLRSFSELS